MKKSTKLIAMLAMIALLTCVMAMALADDKIYTSSVFTIPKERVNFPVAADPEEETEPEDAVTAEEPEAEPDETAEPADEEPEAEEPAAEESKPEAKKEEAKKEAKPVQREVRIYSSRKDTVVRNQYIVLSSELIGFDGVDVRYQWQVDRRDGAGWVNVDGATGAKHTYMADPTTVLYDWRLLVIVDE